LLHSIVSRTHGAREHPLAFAPWGTAVQDRPKSQSGGQAVHPASRLSRELFTANGCLAIRDDWSTAL
jgi:hypothetical protein